MRSRELQQKLADMTGRPLSEIDQRLRRLREHTKIATGPRGNAAPHMSEAEAVFHVLSLVSHKPADAFEVADELFQLEPVQSPTHPDLSQPFAGKSLAHIMIMCMRGNLEEVDFHVRSFEFDEGARYAVMRFDRRSLKGLCLIFCKADHVDLSRRRLYDLDKDAAGGRFVIGINHLEDIGKSVFPGCVEAA